MRFGLILSIVVVAFTSPVYAVDCPAGSSPPTADDIKLGIGREGGCVPDTARLVAQVKDASGAITYLESKVCPGMQVGYDASINPAILKETRVYFTADNQSMDPKFVVCAARFVQEAEKSLQFPICVKAALRSIAHQRASCLDPSNGGKVCGNRGGCSSFGHCPHVNGAALDINPTGHKRGTPEGDRRYRMMHAFARTNASLGVAFTAMNIDDWPHIGPNGQSNCSDPNFKARGISDSDLTPPASPRGVLDRIMQPLRDFINPPQSMMPPSPSSSLPPVTNTGTVLDSIPAPKQNPPPAQFPTTDFPPTSIPPRPKTPEDVLRDIAVGPPKTSPATTTATSTRPLTDEEKIRLAAQQVGIPANFPTNNTPQPSNTAPTAPTSEFAGFNGSPAVMPNNSSDEFLRLYVQTLTRVALAINEIIRIMKGEPRLNANMQPEQRIELWVE